ncbi:MAG: hypothetical protein E7Z87_01225 [Cyanobacteria bacterium SIG26]|nr:hypothetical protein [Cyanobacteria bacterium SIG26]
MSFLSHININPFKNSRVRKILGLPEITETHGILCRRTILGEDKYYLAKDTFSKDSTPIELTKKVKNPHPTNATNELERVMYNHDDIVELYKTNPHLDRTVGSLPQHWGKLVGNSPEKRKAIDAAFTEFGQKYFSLEEKNFEQNISILQNKLSKILEKEIKITPVNNGCWGMVYKISDDGPVDYALKVFHYKDAETWTDENYIKHGNFSELASAIYTSKNEAGKYARFYMGRFGEEQNGYILSRFIDGPNPILRLEADIDMEKHKIFRFLEHINKTICKDKYFENKIGKTIVDFGNTHMATGSQISELAYRIAKNLGFALDTNSHKYLDKIIAQFKDTKDFKNAIKYIQSIIQEQCNSSNCKHLATKKDLLEKLGLDYVPDIKKLIKDSNDIRITKIERELDTIYELPPKAFEDIYTQKQETVTRVKRFKKLINNLDK